MNSSKKTNQLLLPSDHRSQITDYYLIRYAEIALKGKNRRFFENRLAQNILHSLRSQITDYRLQIHNLHSQLLLKITQDQNKVRNRGVYPGLPGQPILVHHLLSQTFGISWFAPVTISSLDIDTLTNSTIITFQKSLATSYKLHDTISFALRVTRHDKSFPLTSRQLEIRLGSAILKSLEAKGKRQEAIKVNLTHPDLTLYIEIFKDRALLYTEKIPGPGGLPVGTASKALCLLSGGFDSVAAAYLMAKRGLQVDFIHFHVFADPHYLKQTKIWTIAQHLAPIVGAKTLYAAAYTPFQIKLMELDKKHQKHELILFRRWMFRTAAQFAAQHGYQAIISGDSLGQVASQTLSNLTAVDETLKAKGKRLKAITPLFRPLIGFDKLEIIDLVKKIGFYDEVIKPYKDCCSLVSKKPATRAHLDTIHHLESQLSLPSLTPQIIPIHIGS